MLRKCHFRSKELNTFFLRNFLWSAIESKADSNEYSYHINIANTNLKRWLNLPKIKDDKPEELVALKIQEDYISW